MADEHDVPSRKHLTRLARVWLGSPTYLVTIRARARQLSLTDERIAPAIVTCLREARAFCDWSVGRYVIMPDHIHFFCASRDSEHDLSVFVGRFKSRSTRLAWECGVHGALWQREFHDHLLRSSESYSAKWEYVYVNPVRAGLCETPEEWPHGGEIDEV